MDLEVDLMYMDLESPSPASDEFSFKLVTCLQTIESASIQHQTKTKEIVTRIVESSMKSLQDQGVDGLQKDILSLVDNATGMLEAELMQFEVPSEESKEEQKAEEQKMEEQKV